MQIQAHACRCEKYAGSRHVFGRAVAESMLTSKILPEDFMNKPNRFLMTLASSALFCGFVVSAGAQQTPDQQTSPSAPSAQQPNETPSQQQTPPAQSPNTSPSQPSQPAPEAKAQTQESGGQVFAGTVTKSGDKYILQIADGTAYDLDHQDLVKKYEGKQVRVKGTLDADGKTIHITQ
jgi:hypothetical protein